VGYSFLTRFTLGSGLSSLPGPRQFYRQFWVKRLELAVNPFILGVSNSSRGSGEQSGSDKPAEVGRMANSLFL